MIFKKESRRSDRLMFLIPLRAEGLTAAGEAFECGGRAVAVNRYGAHIRLDRPIPVTHKIRVTNLENNSSGEFRIVRALKNPSTEEADFGIEALGNYPSFWGIDFRAGPKKNGESRGLLECQHCRSASLLPLSLDEIEVLESEGTVEKPCASCKSKTEWKFASEDVRQDEFLPDPEGAAQGGVVIVRQEEKPERIVFVQRPVSIRTAAGEVETVQTENLSKDEIRCISEKTYEVNQVVTAVWENSGTGQRLQVQGRIRRRQTIAGSQRVIYSIRYEGKPVILPPAPLKGAGGLYGVMGVLVAAASVLLGINVQALASSLAIASGGAHRVAYLGVVLILVCLAYKAWKAVLAREPESRNVFRKRHLIAAVLIAVFFLGSLAVGAVAGVVRGYQRQRAQLFLQDLAMTQIFERNIDAAENRVMSNPNDYADTCATLQMLAGQWQDRIAALSNDASELSRVQLWRNAQFREHMKGFDEIMALDRRKLRLVQEQIVLKIAAQNISSDNQQAFWQSRFPPLRQQILELDAQKNLVVKSLMAEK